LPRRRRVPLGRETNPDDLEGMIAASGVLTSRGGKTSHAAVADSDEETADLVRAVDVILGHADATRRLRIRANADTAEDAARARRLGAQGIGLCRTEHMFLGERRVLVERLVLATDAETRGSALAALVRASSSLPASA